MASQADKVRAKFEAVFAEADPEVVPSIARQIEAEIAAHYTGTQYTSRVRSLCFNLSKNARLRASVLSGDMGIDALVSASPNDLATDAIKLLRQASADRYHAQRSLGETDEHVVGWRAGTSGKLDWSHKYESEKPGSAAAASGARPATAVLAGSDGSQAAMGEDGLEKEEDGVVEEDEEDEADEAMPSAADGASEDAMAWLSGYASKAAPPKSSLTGAVRRSDVSAPPSAKRPRTDSTSPKGGLPIGAGRGGAATGAQSTAEDYASVLVRLCTLAEAGGAKTMDLLAGTKSEADAQRMVAEAVAKVRAIVSNLR